MNGKKVKVVKAIDSGIKGDSSHETKSHFIGQTGMVRLSKWEDKKFPYSVKFDNPDWQEININAGDFLWAEEELEVL